MKVYVICGRTNQMIPQDEVIKVCASYPTAVSIAQSIENEDKPYTYQYTKIYIEAVDFIREDY